MELNQEEAKAIATELASHNLEGNCVSMSVIFDCDECGENVCDVCHDHDEPRGECSECAPCLACKRAE